MPNPYDTDIPGPPSKTEIYEIVKIWIPTHGLITVYRKPNGDFHVENGCQLGDPVSRNDCTKLKILASHGGVITVKRNVDGGYVLHPEEIHYETFLVPIDPNN